MSFIFGEIVIIQLDNVNCVTVFVFSSISATRLAVKLFHSALQRIASPQEEDTQPAEFLVEGSSGE
jgi:hypothetical protein